MKTDITGCAGTFDSITPQGDALHLRFHNGFCFSLDSEEPILVIRLLGCENADRVQEELSALLGEEIDGLAVDRTDEKVVFTIGFCWANDGRPYVVTVRDVAVSAEPYSIADYRNQIVALETRWREESVHRHALTSGIRNIKEHLQEEIVRLRKKRDFFLSHNDTKAESQSAVAAAMSSIIRRIEECEQHAGQVSSEAAPSASPDEPSA